MRWGPELLASDRARFRLWAPDPNGLSVEVAGARPVAMTSVGDGWWEAETAAKAGSRYRFVLPDGMAVPDPASRGQAGGPHGWSVVHDPAAYRWKTQDWRGRPWTEAVIQEVHAGILGGFAGVAEILPALADIGITAIELMPVAAFTGSRNWGYDGVLPYAPAEAYGAPDDLKALVDRAHGLGLMVLLDVVYNHFGPDGNYIGSYAADFFHPERETPWGGAVAVDRDPVRRFFIDNARMWIEEFRLDGLRFDAVHAIEDDAFLDAMAAEIRKGAGADRHVHLVLENEHNDPDRLRPGRYDAQWNDDFHNVLHVLLTGETDSYYFAFAEAPATKLARCLREGFIYQGEAIPDDPERTRGKPSGDLPTTAFVSFLHNHDQIGNRAFGERLTSLADPDALRAATALLLLCPHIPMLFMGDVEGSRAPFLFFTDFHDTLADAVREGRRREFARFAAFSDPEARERIPDPNAAVTFAQSRPEPGPDAEEWRELYVELLRLRHAEIVPRLAGAHGLAAEVLGERSVAARWRMGDGAMLTIAVNLGDAGGARFPQADGRLIFSRGETGSAGSIAVWLAP